MHLKKSAIELKLNNMRMSREQKENAAIMECYIDLYANSNPAADFIELMDNATLNERGQKVINFMDYEIEEVKYNEIVDSIIKKYKFKNYYAQMFRNTIMLGCSPKFKN